MDDRATPEAAQAPLRVLRPEAHIHMIGVAGAGMSALATVLQRRGFVLSGSDQQHNAQTAKLGKHGLTFHQGHDAANVAGADLVIISAAVRDGNVELAAARSAGLPVVKRSAALGWLLEGFRAIAVAGTHGKTTTSAMLAVILHHAGLDPTFVIGGEVLDLDASAGFGKGEWAVVEADEYDRSFLQLRPEIAAITNVEADHLEYYGSVDAMQEAYRQFVARIVPGGTLVVNDGDAYLRSLAVRSDVRVVRCALAESGAAWRAVDLQQDERGSRFRVVSPKGETTVQTPLSGRHNMLNALQALCAAESAGVDISVAASALATFSGTGRRFQPVGDAAGVKVIDDYAHHPTEIRATLAAARARFPGRRIVAVFQPHTYSRLRLLFDEFAGAFDASDLVVVTDIYAARESDTLGMSSAMLTEALAGRLGSGRVLLAGSLTEIPGLIVPRLHASDVVLTLGAGTITELGPRLIEALQAGGAGPAR